MKNIILTIAAIFTISSQVWSQAYDLQFVEVLNEGTVDGNFDIKIQIKTNTGSFDLGLSNLTFDFNTAGLYSGVEPDNGTQMPEITVQHNFASGYYSSQTLTEPQRGTLSLNINYNFETPNNGTSVGTTWMDVATIRFKIRNTAELSGLVWRNDEATGEINPVYINDDASPATIISRNSVSSNNTALPVELLFFTAKKVDDNIVLDWATAVEENCDNFEIQHSTNAIEWETIGETECVSLSFSTRNYNFIDAHVSSPINYYRLKQNDLNGVYEYSHIEVVNLDIKDISDLDIYPNPANGLVNLASTKGFSQNEVKIYSSQGQLVYNQILNENNIQIDISNFPSGIYFVKVDNQNMQKTFIVQ